MSTRAPWFMITPTEYGAESARLNLPANAARKNICPACQSPFSKADLVKTEQIKTRVLAWLFTCRRCKRTLRVFA